MASRNCSAFKTSSPAPEISLGAGSLYHKLYKQKQAKRKWLKFIHKEFLKGYHAREF